eukprot:sb/3474028/
MGLINTSLHIRPHGLLQCAGFFVTLGRMISPVFVLLRILSVYLLSSVLLLFPDYRGTSDYITPSCLPGPVALRRRTCNGSLLVLSFIPALGLVNHSNITITVQYIAQINLFKVVLKSLKLLPHTLLLLFAGSRTPGCSLLLLT